MASVHKSGPPTAKVSDIIQNFAPTRRFGASPSQRPYNVTSLDFDDSGELCLVAQDDETLQIYNCKEGKHAKELKSQKYGVDLARFAHHPQSIIYASTKGDDAIRYLSSHDNTYIRYFRGHTATVTSLALSPADDTFLSTSLDNSLRQWDLRSSHAAGILYLHSPHLTAYDPTATVIAVACPPAQSILLYDARNYDKAPFATFDLLAMESALRPDVNVMAAPDWTKLEFSNDGSKILVATNGAGHYVLDAFEGKLMGFCARPGFSPGHDRRGLSRVPPGEYTALRARQSAAGKSPQNVGASSQGDACFSPDGRYVISGSGAGTQGVFVYDTHDLQPSDAAGSDKVVQPLCNLLASATANPGTGAGDVGSQDVKNAVGAAAVVGYSPRHNLLVTADRGVVFWLPETD